MSSVTDVVVIGAGQSGLAAARALLARGVSPVVLEAGIAPAGSWPCYYDSLKAFSPAGRPAPMPGMSFPGDPDRYPARDEVADYLESYAAGLGVEIRTGARVAMVGRRTVSSGCDGGRAALAGRRDCRRERLVLSPYRPVFPGQERFTGELTHVADYRNPAPYAGKRVVVVGAGDSAAQVANELAPLAKVTLAARHPLRFIPQRIGGKDVHHWLGETGFDSLPAEWLDKITGGSVITDSVGFQQTLADGLLDVRPMFAGLDGDHVVWNSGARAGRCGHPGHRLPPQPRLPPRTRRPGPGGAPLHAGGISTTHLGWSTSAWNTSAPSPRTPSAGSALTPPPSSPLVAGSATPLAPSVSPPRRYTPGPLPWRRKGRCWTGRSVS